MVVTPLRWSLVALLAGSVVYEPLRQTVEGQFGQAVGGVGGVGGLTNQWGPVQRTSSTSSGSGALYVSACGDQAAAVVMAYCFHPGVLFGLTPFALVVLCAWVGPLVLGAVLAARSLTPQMHLQKFSKTIQARAGDAAVSARGCSYRSGGSLGRQCRSWAMSFIAQTCGTPF